MEWNEKLQELRKQKGLTQEELAESLYVSRTAVSKWESGRGYPNIDSLKHLSKFFGVSIDQLLSSDEVLNLAQEDNRQWQTRLRDLVFGLLDLCVAIFLFLPLFGQKSGEHVYAVSLLSLQGIAPYLKSAYWGAVISILLWGILTLALQNCPWGFWQNHKHKISLLLNGIGALLFIISSQPYAATILLIFLGIKVLILTKKQ